MEPKNAIVIRGARQNNLKGIDIDIPLGEMLVDIHGQHAHQSLLKRQAQRKLLDHYAGHDGLVSKVSDAYSGYQQTLQRYQILQNQAKERSSRLDYLRYQIQELDAVALDKDGIVGLEEEHKRLAHADRLMTETNGILDQLKDSDYAAHSTVSRVRRDLEDLAQLDNRLTEALDLVETAQVQIDEASSLLRGYVDQIDLDPGRLQVIDAQLSDLHDLARKHQVSPEGLPQLHHDLQEELDVLENADVALADMGKQLDQYRQNYYQAASALTESRKKTADKLSRIVTEKIQGLNLSGGKFQVQIEELPADKFSQHGLNQIDFLVAANPGQTPAPLNKVASGGELSRISLALQVATANCGEVPTLIFDEVDVGIGGAVAEIVGQLLRNLGRSRQVLCVTHLPQVASQGDHHLLVSKSSKKDQVRTKIIALDDKQRTKEIARMLGGLEITKQTISHADEMIRRAKSQP